jgi:hypothetical protein
VNFGAFSNYSNRSKCAHSDLIHTDDLGGFSKQRRRQCTQVSFPGVKRQGRGSDHPLTSSSEVKERVQL